MSNGSVEIDETTFKNMNSGDRDWLVLRTVIKNKEESDKRLDCLEKKKLRDTGLSAWFGLVGGAIAVLMKSLFFKSN